ncbi:C1 family peptidase [Flammeovirga yaeyamensis]|uniref:Aminopeptidase n=1 Tax=Flammeovirga yaeyamensis TaxID=367791 RepID=A0AAX1N5E0_9BACT|nr:C1 family peptidase [Flammeovirga yaeyamensis]MBB3697355.1 bleomycin hydrolase [Flammeovirga yaeyamensis]NMF36049.1 aminopeptidase [Flammeovirga yaeyamensis]QWG02784.1 C1 family peptidase [Flammeovirga yaeyamensis]
MLSIKKILASVLLAGASTLTVFGQETIVDGTQLKVVNQVKTTPVKSQGRTGTCWSFSTTSFIESELMRKGKGEFDLSEMYFVRNTYPLKAKKYIRKHGKAQFGEGGLAHDVMNIIREKGFVPNAVYDGKNGSKGPYDHQELFGVMESVLKTLSTSRTISDNWDDAFNAILDAYMGGTPVEFEFEGKSYTPQKFASNLDFNPDDYVELTSYDAYKTYAPCVLEIPDNWSDGIYYNLPLSDLQEVMNNALNKGYSLTWDGDVSEKSFSHKNGKATIEEKDGKEIEVTSSLRQTTFDNYSTTDDHLMHIVGIVKDKDGALYYVTKNSWGAESNDFGGYLYMSEGYVKLKTVSIMVHKDAIPSDIKKKIGLI